MGNLTKDDVLAEMVAGFWIRRPGAASLKWARLGLSSRDWILCASSCG